MNLQPINTQTQNALIPFSYTDIELKESCWIDRKPYFTGRAIGEWLEYQYPQEAVDKIVNRSPNVLQFATQVRLTCVEGSREVARDIRVFDPIGFQLIVNKSSQPMAIAFQIAVARMVLAYVKGELKPVTSRFTESYISEIKQIAAIPNKTDLIKELSKKSGVDKRRIYEDIIRITGTRLRPQKPRHDSKEKTLAIAYVAVNQDRGGRYIKKALNLSANPRTITRWLFENKHKNALLN